VAKAFFGAALLVAIMAVTQETKADPGDQVARVEYVPRSTLLGDLKVRSSIVFASVIM
jgi:hypothetical protein